MPKTVDKSEQIGLFPFPPTGNGNDQPCQLLQIKYELKLPSEVMPGLVPFRFRSEQCEYDECCSVPLRLEFSNFFPKNKRPLIV